jgi:WD40 repeat protein
VPAPAARPDDGAREWSRGDVLLDLYVVMGLLGEGGMGRVYKVHHRGWNVELAVKSPKAEIFARAGGKDDFVREAETWVSLGLHAHVASCHYVRTLDLIPRVFAEYVEGGSLSDWIRSRRLYEGGAEKALERVLDVAIQMAWGLEHAHEHGLVHQDVKPANVLMTPEGTAKVTDFGLARARRAAAGSVTGGSEALASVGGLTPAYCSPEQARGEPLSAATDVWSWGLSVVEMFTGGVTWLAGQGAREVLDDYLERPPDEGLPPMPSPLAALLRRVFTADPGQRPLEDELARELVAIHHDALARPYPRAVPSAVDLRADGLNNRALALIELGREEEARRAWEAALVCDPQHVETTFNHGVWEWSRSAIPDDVLVRRLEALQSTGSRTAESTYLAGMVNLQRGALDEAVRSLEEAARLLPPAQRADAWAALGSAHRRVGHEDEARAAFDQARGSAPRTTDRWARLRLPQLVCTGVLDARGVFCIDLAPDGRLAISGHSLGTLVVWDLLTATPRQTLEGHTGLVWSVRLLPDGRSAVSGGEDGTVRLWDLASGRCLRVLEGHSEKVMAVSASPDGAWLLSAGGDATLRLWELSSGRCVRMLEDTGWVSAVAFSPDGRTAASGGMDGRLTLWDLTTSASRRAYDKRDPLTGVRFLRGGARVMTTSRDGALRCFGVGEGVMVERTLRGHTSSVECLAVSPDGNWILSGSGDRTLRVWDPGSGRCLRTLDDHADRVNSVAIAAGGRAVSASFDETVRIWEVDPPTQLFLDSALCRPRESSSQETVAREAESLIERARLASARKDYAQAFRDARNVQSLPGFERWDPALTLLRSITPRGRPVAVRDAWLGGTWEGHVETVIALAVTRDGHRVVSGSQDGSARLWEVATGKSLRVFPGVRGHWISAVAITPDGRRVVAACGKPLATGPEAASILTWELESGAFVRRVPAPTLPMSLAISPKGVVVFASGRAIAIMDVGGDRPLAEMGDDAVSVALSPDGRQALSGGSNGGLRLWDLGTRRCLVSVEGHGGYVHAVAFSADGRRALSGGEDGRIQVWDAGSLRSLHCLEPARRSGRRAMRAVAFSPDGHWALAGSEDRIVRVWDLERGLLARELHGHTDWVSAVSFFPDACGAISSGGDGKLRRWVIDWELAFPVVKAPGLLGRLFGARRNT